MLRLQVLFICVFLFVSCVFDSFSVLVYTPELPSALDGLVLDWCLFVITEEGEALRVDDVMLSDSFFVGVPAFSSAVFLLVADVAGRYDILSPAGAVILPGEDAVAHLDWEKGPLVSVLYELVRNGFSLSSFNVKRLFSEAEERLDNPWMLDKDRLRFALTSYDFSVYDIAERESFSVSIVFPPGNWVSDAPFFNGVFSGAGNVVLPVGFSRFLASDGSCFFSVFVDERGRVESGVFYF